LINPWTNAALGSLCVETRVFWGYQNEVDARGLTMRSLLAAMIIGLAGLAAAPASATNNQVLVQFCENFLDRYESMQAQHRDLRQSGHRVYLARYHYYQHLRRKARQTARFCQHFLASQPPHVSPSSNSHSYSYIVVRNR
jgi:hypothetical protein